MLTKLIIIGIIIVLLGVYSCTSYKPINKTTSDNFYFNFFKTTIHYIPMGNWFELGNNTLDGIDIQTVEILSRNHLKDKSQVYFKSSKIKNADASSFRMLCSNNDYFARDKNMIYYENNSFENLDIHSVTFLGDTCGSVLKDKHHVYSIRMEAIKNGIISPIKNADPETYQVLTDLYGKDNIIVYYKGLPIADADANTFTLIGEYYAKDIHTIYYQGLQVRSVDAITFQLIDGGGYTKDRNNVYYGLDAVMDKDQQVLYYVGKVVAGADAGAFTMIKGEKVDYAKDTTSYYWGGIKQ
ncbi:MAG: DKNYY domain-containing protein [Cytophagales bacterium]|nr:DKNYY domain-containing protein [Cytophaga sp.]